VDLDTTTATHSEATLS